MLYLIKMTKEGYVYILYNIAFKQYGENVYKIGCTNNIEKRINSYITGYLDKSEIKYKTEKIKNYDKIEKVVHYELKEFRIKKRREFFNCSLDTIKEYIEKVINYSEEKLNNIFSEMKNTSVKNESMTISKSLEIIVNQVRKIEEENQLLSTNLTNSNNSLNVLVKAYFKKWLKEKYIYRNELIPSTTIYENSIITEFNKELNELNVINTNEIDIKEYIIEVFDKTQRVKSKSKDEDKSYYYKNLDLR